MYETVSGTAEILISYFNYVDGNKSMPLTFTKEPL